MTENQPVPPQPSDTPGHPAETKPAEIKPKAGPDPATLSIIERAALEMVGRKPPKRAAGPVATYTSAPARDVPAPAPRPASTPAPWAATKPPGETNLTAETKSADHIDPVEIDPVAAPAPAKIAPPASPPMFDDHFRLALTNFQSASLAVAIFACVVAAIGMAASGWASAHDWTCRVGLAINYCPAQPAIPKPPALPEIPS